MTLVGRCFCGDVSFEVHTPTLWCGHCHCSMCQQIHGSGIVTWVGCVADSVEVTGDVRWFESSEGAFRGSCARCTTQLFFRSVNWPGELHITRTSFRGEIDREPAGHSYFSTHVPWLVHGDDLPRKA